MLKYFDNYITDDLQYSINRKIIDIVNIKFNQTKKHDVQDPYYLSRINSSFP